MIIIPPSLFTTPLRGGGGGSSDYSEGRDIAMFFAAFMIPLLLAFVYMWYDVEFNIKPAQERARQAQLAAIQKYRDDCAAAGNVIKDTTATRYWVDKYSKRHYYSVPAIICVTP